MFIKHLSKNIFDVFVGDRWDNWTRVQRFHWGIRVVDGKPLNRSSLAEVKERLVRK